jgi:hypothetical protein
MVETALPKELPEPGSSLRDCALPHSLGQVPPVRSAVRRYKSNSTNTL